MYLSKSYTIMCMVFSELVGMALYTHVHGHIRPQSTPLHLAAGYNRVGVVELLLQQGADVHAKDKG